MAAAERIAASGVVKNQSQAIDTAPVIHEKARASPSFSAPVTSGRFCVRVITRSMSRSI
jgi:hypothetical protein